LCIPQGRLENVEIDFSGVKTVADFEVIDIMGDKDHYPALLGIDWCYDNYAVTPCFPQFVKITILAKNCGEFRNVNV
jgi:hypothetical protein